MKTDYTLASATNFMAQKQPFWPEDWVRELPTGAKMLMVPPAAELKTPIFLELMPDQEVLIAVGAGANVQFYEGMTGEGSATVRLFVGEKAQVTYVANETTSRGVGNKMHREAVVDAHAKITWFGATLNQDRFSSQTKSWIRGREGESNMHWLNLSKEKQQVDVTVTTVFDATDVRGQMFIKAAAKDQAQVHVRGEIFITLDGGGTDSYLKEDTLILDPRARVRALPCLEIKTNDVKAGHGATVTNFTDEDLFYLQSRGILPKQAKQMMVKGFLESALADCPHEEFVEKVVGMLD